MIHRSLNGAVAAAAAGALAMACTAALSAPAAQAAPESVADDRIEIRAVDVSLPALVQTLSDVLGRNVVLGPGFPSARVSLDESHGSFDQWVQAMQERARVTTLWIDNTPLLGSECMKSARVDIAPGYGGRKISLNFQRGDTNLLFGFVQEVAKGRTIPVVQPLSPLLPLTVRLKDVDVAKAAAMIATASAMDVRAAEGGVLHYRLPPERTGCFPLLAEGPSTLGYAQGTVARSCIRLQAVKKDGKEISCEHLERYRRDELTLRALVRAKGKPYGLVETSDGLLYAVGMGQYLGGDFGRVMQIDRMGLRLREIVQNKDGDFEEVMVRMDLASASASKEPLPAR